MTVGSSIRVVSADSVAVSAFLVATSQPRTSTLLTWAAEVSTERNRSRSLPSCSTSGSVFARPPAGGAALATAGAAKENLPSRTATSRLLARARADSTSQSVCPAWL